MDPAICGYCRSGYFRCGVYKTDWDDKILAKLENVSAKHAGGMTPAIWGTLEWGQFRWGVAVPLFDELITKMEKTSSKHAGGMTPAVWGTMKWGQFRWGVVIPLFDELKNEMEKK